MVGGLRLQSAFSVPPPDRTCAAGSDRELFHLDSTTPRSRSHPPCPRRVFALTCLVIAPSRVLMFLFLCARVCVSVRACVDTWHGMNITHDTQGAALLYTNFMKDFLAKSDANPIPAEGKVEVREKGQQ